MRRRLAFTLLVLISATVLPFYITAPLALVGIFFFRNYYEIALVFLVHDVVYGARETRFFDFPYVTSAFSAVLVFVSEWIRRSFLRERGTRI